MTIQKKMCWTIYSLLLLIALPLFFINISDTHSWGDDFAQYIKEAQNIVAGQPFYQSNYIFNPYNTIYAPPQYPPGFPLLLAPVIKLCGLSFTALCYFNSVIAVCLLLVLFTFFRSYLGITAAICMAVTICYSTALINLKGNVLADVPCLLFITLYLTIRKNENFNKWQITSLIALATIAIQVRTQAIFLLAAEALYLLWHLAISSVKARRRYLYLARSNPALYVVPTTLFLTFLCDRLIFRTPNSSSSFYGHLLTSAWNSNITDWAEKHLNNIYKVATSFFFYPNENDPTKTIVGMVENAAITFCICGCVIKIRRNFEMHDVFFIIICLVVLFFPFFDTRYFLPAVPMLFVYCYTALKAFLPSLITLDLRRFAVCATVLYLWAGSSFLFNATAHTNDLLSDRDMNAFAYIANNVKDDEIIVFNKPRALTLFTNKKSINLSLEIPPFRNRKVFDSVQAKYLLIATGVDDRNLKYYIRHVQRPVDSATIAEGYMLYTLR